MALIKVVFHLSLTDPDMVMATAVLPCQGHDVVPTGSLEKASGSLNTKLEGNYN